MIIIQNLNKSFGDRVIIRDFSYHFPSNTNIGIVGANGAGKTTLLNIITGIEEHNSGEVIIPKNCVLGYLPQSPSPTPLSTILEECISGNQGLINLQEKLNASLKRMEENYSEEVFNEYESLEKEFSDKGGYALEAEAKGILVGLGFETTQFNESPLELSGGWRMRLELAKLLVNKPNFLILDEPTNHLDLPSLTWLEGYLKSFKGTLLFVSHDREFLNNLSDKILHISSGNLKIYNGTFDDFIEQKEENTKLIKKQLETIKRKQNHLQDFVDRFRSKASKAKQAQSKIKIIERLKKMEERLDTDTSDEKPVFKLEIEKQSGKVVLDVKEVAIGYDAVVLKDKINLRLIRGNKVAIIGTNGVGKSTLLKSIVGEIPLISGSITIGNNVTIGYYAQSQLDILDPNLTALENILNISKTLTQQQARSLLGNLLIKRDDVNKSVKVLSGGEKSKVAIAAILSQRNNLLILDEPTNHLDMSSIEALSQTLKDYNGTVLAVSHNRSFINSFASHLLIFEKNQELNFINI